MVFCKHPVAEWEVESIVTGGINYSVKLYRENSNRSLLRVEKLVHQPGVTEVAVTVSSDGNVVIPTKAKVGTDDYALLDLSIPSKIINFDSVYNFKVSVDILNRKHQVEFVKVHGVWRVTSSGCRKANPFASSYAQGM